jgi:hypothetical protein
MYGRRLPVLTKAHDCAGVGCRRSHDGLERQRADTGSIGRSVFAVRKNAAESRLGPLRHELSDEGILPSRATSFATITLHAEPRRARSVSVLPPHA